jgi:hypothetical protein
LNGYTNYPTYAVASWFANKEHAYLYATALAEASDHNVRVVSAQLKADSSEGLLTCSSTLEGYLKDLLEHAVELVNWDEVADLFCVTVPKQYLPGMRP